MGYAELWKDEGQFCPQGGLVHGDDRGVLSAWVQVLCENSIRIEFMTRSTAEGEDLPPTRSAPTRSTAKGAVSPVRNQGQGETCWANQSDRVEGAMVAVGGAETIDLLSPQYLEDCMNIPCANSSGTPDNAFGMDFQAPRRQHTHTIRTHTLTRLHFLGSTTAVPL